MAFLGKAPQVSCHFCCETNTDTPQFAFNFPIFLLGRHLPNLNETLTAIVYSGSSQGNVHSDNPLNLQLKDVPKRSCRHTFKR